MSGRFAIDQQRQSARRQFAVAAKESREFVADEYQHQHHDQHHQEHVMRKIFRKVLKNVGHDQSAAKGRGLSATAPVRAKFHVAARFCNQCCVMSGSPDVMCQCFVFSSYRHS